MPKRQSDRHGSSEKSSFALEILPKRNMVKSGQDMFSKAHGIVQHFVSEGSRDKPVLVFANSLGSDLRIWDGVVSHLVGDFTIIRYDKRGHGLSDVPAPPYSLDDFVLDLVGLLDALEIKEATVCGLSVGGVIAQGLAISRPDRVRGLVLCDTGMRIGSFASWEERIATVKESGLSKLVGPSMERWFTVAFRENRSVEMQGYANMLLRIPREGYLGACYALRDADLTQATPKIINRRSSCAVIRTLRRRRISGVSLHGRSQAPAFLSSTRRGI